VTFLLHPKILKEVLKIVSDKIRIKRGNKANLPNLDVAEFGFCIDTRETFIGSDIGNIQLAKKSDIPSSVGGGVGNTSYLIELDRWGIIQGIPTKPYANQNYTNANNNITGINNALAWAKDNNYDYVIFPRGEYSICYPNQILTQPNMTIDFNFSTFKVLYDSDVRSPFDLSQNPIYEFGGDSILCSTPYTHIINLKLIGDRIDRSWVNTDEKLMESSNGIKFSSGSDYSSIRNCNISHYMGDAIALYYAPYNSIEIGQMEFGDFNTTTGATITSSDAKRVRSINFINLTSDMTSFTLIGLGYSPSTSIPSGMYDVYFYKSDDTFINYKKNIRTRDLVQLPKGTGKIKLSWVGNGTVDDGLYPDNPPYWALIVKNGLSNNAIIEYNEIHRCHRGGLFLGTNNVTIRKNYFHDTGMDGSVDIDGLPTFPDGTRYAINTEDNVGHNCKIQDNVFDNIRLAIALRGELNEITGNEFKNCNVGVQLYYLKNCLVDKNYFHYSGVGNFEYNNFDRNWSFTNNVFSYSTVNFIGSGTTTSFTNNFLVNGSVFMSTISVLNFKSNTFNGSNYFWTATDTLVDGCTFINNGSITMSSLSKSMDQIIRCKFINSFVRAQNSPQVIVRDSYFKDSAYQYSTGNCIYTLINCKVDNTSKGVIYSDSALDIGTVNHTLEIKDSTVSLVDKGILQSVGWGKLIIHRSNITYNLTVDKTNALLDLSQNITNTLEIKNSTISAFSANASHSINGITNVTLVDNTFTNFSLLNASATIKRFDSTVPYIRIPDTGAAAPISIPQYIGQTYIDTTNKKIYQAVGTSSSADWVMLN
jgi:hypothetical protein